MTRVLLLLSLMPLLFVSGGCAVKSRQRLSFPHRERDMSRITTFQILCEGGACDNKYIQTNLLNLEQHFRLADEEVRREVRNSSLSLRFFLKIHVVAADALRVLLRQELSRALHVGWLIDKELYVDNFLPAKNDPALNLALQTYIRETYWLVHRRRISPEEMKRITDIVATNGRATIDATFLQK